MSLEHADPIAQGASASAKALTVTLAGAGTLSWGGYTATNWNTASPITQVTVLDAQGKGHGLIATAPLTVSGFTVLNGYVDISANYYDGAGIFAGPIITTRDVDS